MKYSKKLLAALLAATITIAVGGCGTAGSTQSTEDEAALIVGYDAFGAFSGKFSPFFADTTYDYDVVSMTGITLLTSDRAGAVVYHGITGEIIPYQGTDYTYYGPADLEVTEAEDGTVTYDFTLREDLTFSDGVPVTIDDVIFSLYVLCDPSYDGPSTLCNAPIQGLEEYRQNSVSLSALLAQLGEENHDFSLVTEDQKSAFWDAVNNGLVAYAQEITSRNQDSLSEQSPSAVAAAYGIDLAENATMKEFALALGDSVGWNFDALESRFDTSDLASDLTALSDLIPEEVYQYSHRSVSTGESASNISGIQKTGDYSMRIVSESVDVELLYQLGSVVIAPMHYYGNTVLYDYDGNAFGFPKGDLSSVRAKTAQPMGAGPYQYVQYENGAVNFLANPSYYLGTPKTARVVFQVVPEESAWEMQDGLLSGTLDISPLSAGWSITDEIWEAEGDQISIVNTDGRNYSYIGLNPECMNVAGIPDSEESKNLRRAFCTIFAVCRDAAIIEASDQNTGQIESPISNTIWASPREGDPGYVAAFSKDGNGTNLYTSEMTRTQRLAAASSAALDYFEAAGYTVTDGKVTDAPEGAAMEYEMQVDVVNETKDPMYQVIIHAQAALAELGINLIINNVFAMNEYTPVEIGVCDLWADQWNDIDIQGMNWSDIKWIEWYYLVDPNPAMYQIYFADTANNGRNAGMHNNVYHIADPELDGLILEACATTDQDARKAIYRDCLDIIMDWACEVPVYQEQAHILFSNERINSDTIPTALTASYSWLREIQQIELN